MRKKCFLLGSCFCLLAATNISAQNWVAATGGGTAKFRVYDTSQMPRYTFVGEETFFGAELNYSSKGGIITKVHQLSPAADFNFKQDDIITAIGKHQILSAADYEKALASYKEKDEVTIAFIRDGEKRTRVVVMGKISVFKSEKGDKALIPSELGLEKNKGAIRILDTTKD